jgi:rhodanese-related sulfurtransferase
LFRTIKINELKEIEHGSQCIDVRSATEFATGHLPGAINIPLDQLEGRLKDLDMDRKLLLVCQSGGRARLAAAVLERHGKDVMVLQGGTAAWIKEELPVVATVRNRWSLERQARFGAGMLVVVGVVLGNLVGAKWDLLAGFAGMGLLFAGLTDICPMGILLGKLPWNRASHDAVPSGV